MVVAGVYLVARMMPLFEASCDGVLDFVIAIGLITTFLSVFMGLVQSDIKRVVAYSTLNSLGLMMVALGFGEAGVGAAMLYLFCHAFFKALLFLGCGSVIHATEQQEVDELGGLCGQDADHEHDVPHRRAGDGRPGAALRLLGEGRDPRRRARTSASSSSILVLITLPITAMYMMRVYLLTFFGEPKDQHVYEHAHESPPVMTLPADPARGPRRRRRLRRVRGRRRGARASAAASSASSRTCSRPTPHALPVRLGRWRSSRPSSCVGGLGAGVSALGAATRRRAKAAAQRFPFFYQLFLQPLLHRRRLPVGDQQRRARPRASSSPSSTAPSSTTPASTAPARSTNGARLGCASSRRPASCRTTRWRWSSASS